MIGIRTLYPEENFPGSHGDAQPKLQWEDHKPKTESSTTYRLAVVLLAVPGTFEPTIVLL